MTSMGEKMKDSMDHSIQPQDQQLCRIVKLDDTAEIHLYPTVEAANLASAKRLDALLGSNCVFPCMPKKELRPVQENQIEPKHEP